MNIAINLVLALILCSSCTKPIEIQDTVQYKYATDPVFYEGKVVFPTENRPNCRLAEEFGLAEAIENGKELTLLIMDKKLNSQIIHDFLSNVHNSLDSLKRNAYNVVEDLDPNMYTITAKGTEIFYQIIEGEIVGANINMAGSSESLKNLEWSDPFYWLEMGKIRWNFDVDSYDLIRIVPVGLMESKTFNFEGIDCFKTSVGESPYWVYTIVLKRNGANWDVAIE